MILEKKVGSVTINFCSQHALGVIAHTISFPSLGLLSWCCSFYPCSAWSCQLQDAAVPLVVWWEWSPGEETLPGCFGAALECRRALSAQWATASLLSALLHWGQRFLVRELTENFGAVGRENEFFFSLLQVNLVVLFNRVNFIKSICYQYHFLCSKNILQYP